MSVRLAMLFYSNEAHVWRLRLEPGEGSSDKLLELPGFGGSLNDPDDLEKVNLILASWGVYPDNGGWTNHDGEWVVPVLERR